VTTIVWVSRHAPLPAQIRALRERFGENARIIVDPRPFSSAEEIVQRFREVNGDEMVVVAPLSVIAALCAQGIRPLYARMVPIPAVEDPDTDCWASGRAYRFVQFERISEVRLVTEPL